MQTYAHSSFLVSIMRKVTYRKNNVINFFICVQSSSHTYIPGEHIMYIYITSKNCAIKKSFKIISNNVKVI